MKPHPGCSGRGLHFAIAILGFAGFPAPSSLLAGTTNYQGRGVVKEVRQAERQLVIAHEAIPNFMDAMTMPFNVKDAAFLRNVAAGEQVSFQLHVTETESWVDHIERLDGSRLGAVGRPALAAGSVRSETEGPSIAAGRAKNPLRNYAFTNELGKPVSLSDFHGQAIALTFFFTRCPIPEFCPRLSRNFEAAQRELSSRRNAPTNWHFISVTIDPEHDTPELLRTYGTLYHYDPVHWTFLTGPKDKIAELARLCDVKFDFDNGSINHNFRTLIIDASNRLQMVFPTSGDLSDAIVRELLKATGGTNRIL